jgi:predicted CoA-binding protein
MISGKGYIKVIEIFRTMWIILKIIDFAQVINFTVLWVDNSHVKTPIEELSKEKL